MKPRTKSYLKGPLAGFAKRRSIGSDERRNLIQDRLFAMDEDEDMTPRIIVLENKAKQKRPTLKDAGQRPSLRREFSRGLLGRKTKSAEGLTTMRQSLIERAPKKSHRDSDDESVSSVESDFSDQPRKVEGEKNKTDASSVSSLDRIKSIAAAGLSIMSTHSRTKSHFDDDDDSCSLSSFESDYSDEESDTEPPIFKGSVQRVGLQKFSSIKSIGSTTSNHSMRRMGSPRGRARSNEDIKTLGSPLQRFRSKSNESLRRIGSPLLTKSKVMGSPRGMGSPKGMGSPRSPRKITRARSNEGLRELQRVASIQDEEKKEKKKQRPSLLERGFSKLEKVYNDCV